MKKQRILLLNEYIKNDEGNSLELYLFIEIL